MICRTFFKNLFSDSYAQDEKSYKKDCGECITQWSQDGFGGF